MSLSERLRKYQGTSLPAPPPMPVHQISLSGLIRKYAGGRSATATPATVATGGDSGSTSVATVATVAVANPVSEHTARQSSASIRSNCSKSSSSEAEDAKNVHPTESQTTFTPYIPPMPAALVRKMVDEIKESITALSQAEGWSDVQRAHVLALVARQPIFTLADDLTYFRDRLACLQTANAVVENLVRT